MNKKEFEKRLETEKEFKNIDKWEFIKIKQGEVSPHTYILKKGKKKYFVKEIKSNEKDSWKLLIKFNSKISPKALFKKLIEKNILIYKYLEGKNPKTIKLHPSIIINYAEIQNKFANRKNYKRGNWKKYLNELFAIGKRNLNSLKKYNLQITKKYNKIYENLIKEKENLIKEFSNMPYAYIHHDFKDNNIITLKNGEQKLIDWGSSKYMIPYLFDLAPYLQDKKSKKIFYKKSNIAKKKSWEEYEREIYICQSIRFIEFLRWRLNKNTYKNKQECKEFLEHEIKKFHKLI